MFTVEVEDVLKGDAPPTIEVNGLRSGIPLRGELTCRQSSNLYATLGDRVALAFDGKVPGVKGRVNSAAWVEGEPFGLNPGLGKIDVNNTRLMTGLEPLPSFRAIISGDTASLDAGTLTLDGVPAVAFVSEWPSPSIGQWSIGSFVDGWAVNSGELDAQTAVLSMTTPAGIEVVALQVTGIETIGETISLSATPIDGDWPADVSGPASLFLDVEADPSSW